MQTQVTIRDELIFRVGPPPTEFILALPAGQISIRDLIRSRVEQEVDAYNQAPAEHFAGLIQPSAAEQSLNGYRMPRQRRIDPADQVRRALDAFEQNGFMVLVDDRQVERLDDQFVLGPGAVVTFLKLVPLVGG